MSTLVVPPPAAGAYRSPEPPAMPQPRILIVEDERGLTQSLSWTFNREGFETVVVRPRFVWGRGDTTLLPTMVQMVESGRFAWIGGGHHLTSITHVDNTVEGLLLGATRGRPGNAYFVTDGEPVVFRDFVSELLETQGVEPPTETLRLHVRAMISPASATYAWAPFELASHNTAGTP